MVQRNKISFRPGSYVHGHESDIQRRVPTPKRRECQSDCPPCLLVSSIVSPTALLAVPNSGDLGMPHLLLKLEDTKHECLGSRWASGNVNVDWDDSVATSGDRVGVVVVATTVGARAHGDDPSGVRHLVVNLSQSRGHLVGEGTGDNHDIGLTRGGTENNTHSVLVVTWGGKVHHLNSAAGETEGHGPERALTRPVCDLIEGGAGELVSVQCLATTEVCSFIPHTVRIAWRPACLPGWAEVPPCGPCR